MEKLFDKILDPKYRVDLDSVQTALSVLGYKIGKDEYRVLATKYTKGYRFHVSITLLPTGQIDRYCHVGLHKDMGTHLFHKSILNDDDIYIELCLFRDTLSNIVKRKKIENDMDVNRKDINDMLRYIGILEKHFDCNHERRMFIKEFRRDLNILFEVVEDSKEDFRKSLVVMLLDIVDQISIRGFERQELIIIKDMTKLLLSPVLREKLDYYTSLAIEKHICVGRNHMSVRNNTRPSL